MAEISDKILLAGGSINTDDGSRSIAKGEFLDIVNCRTIVTENSNDGVAENVRGNTLIANILPAGDNKTIGSYEDKSRKRIIYFNWNFGKADGIYQFYPDRGTNGEIETIFLDDPNNPVLKFDPNFKITGINIVQSLTGDLLYWTENSQRPRKINIDKSNETNKLRKFDIFLKVNSVYTTTIFDPSGAVAFSWNTINPTAGSKPLDQAVAFYLANIPPGALALAKFHTCYQFLEAEMLLPGMYTMSISSPANTPVSYIVANNFYPLPFKEEFIDAIKYPPICEPLVEAKQDLTKNLNLIQNKVFQFRIRLGYDDNEKSVYSPYSRIPSLPIACGADATQSTFNYIEVDFDEPRLFDLGSLSIINKVEVAVRERNSGKLKHVITLDKWEFLQNNNTFNFYNDGIYSVIDAAIDGKNYDALPLLAKSQEFGVNRIEYGGITEGYDPVCIDAKLNLSYEPNLTTKTFGFNGRIYIKNLFANTNWVKESQPIRYDNDDNTFTGYVFGGMGTGAAGNVDEGVLASDYHQNIPLGGFVMYLAGTQYRAKSKQPDFSAVDPDVDQDSNGVLNAEKVGQRNAIREIMQTANRCYSEFTFAGIPPGKYILRVASHLLTDNDLNDTSLAWQKTSTTASKIAGQGSAADSSTAFDEVVHSTGLAEAVIDIDQNGTIFVNGVSFGQNNPRIPDTEIVDISNPQIVASSRAIGGYVTDDDITPPLTQSNTVSEWLSDTRIELAKIKVVQNDNVSVGNYTECYTDHNGFFWAARKTSPIIAGSWVDSVIVGKVNSMTNSFSPPDSQTKDLFSGSPVIKHTAKGFFYGVYRCAVANFDNLRTKLTGNINFNGQSIANLNVLTTRGRFDKTDVTGSFDLIVYTDTTLASNADLRTDILILGVPDSCLIVFQQTNYTVAFSSTPDGITTFNFTTTKTVVIPITSIQGQDAQVALKRGGRYSIGITYYDNAIRDNNVNTSEFLDLKIPFYTELIPGTTQIVAQGRPIVEVEINNLPPEWATHYQIVRTLNGNQGRYLQWTAKTITYVDDNGTTVPQANATQIKIDLEGTTAFNSVHVDSKVSYTYEDGDRLVLIKSASGNFFNTYIDFKVKGSKTGASLILYVDNLVSAGSLTPGVLFEIYNPKKNFDLELYYEIGECYEIGNPGQPTAFHKGLSQDQIVLNGASTQPAKVKLTTGDTWYRYRTMNYSSTNVIGSSADSPVTWFIEDASISDFYDSKDQSIGRFNVLNKDLGRRYRPTAIRFSNVLIEETKINGLNSFEGLNEKVLPLEYGLIQKLIMSKDVLCAIHNNSEFVTMYLGKDVLLDNSAQSLVAVSNQVIQKSYQYQGGLGTQNPESICIDEDNTVYGYDNNKGIAWAKEVNGLVPISEIKMRTFFRNKSQEINSNGGTFVYGAYDNRYNQFILSFEGVISVAPGVFKIKPDTIAFNKGSVADGKSGWESRYEFYPEYFGGAINNVMVHFKDGQLWRHNSIVYCNFFGVQYKQKIKIVSNNTPSDTKVFQYLSTESSDAWSTLRDGISTLENQKSELAKTDWELDENVWKTSFLRDANTPNVNYPESLWNGDELRSSIITMELENDSVNYSTIYAVNVYVILSQTTNK